MIVGTHVASTTHDTPLVVNADDFGLSDGVNAGIVDAFTRGIVRSASLMVHGPAAEAAAALAHRHPGLGVGLHIDIGEWFLRDGDWFPLYERAGMGDRDALEREVRWQWDRFLRLMGRPPRHLDSHQHVHLRDPLGALLRALAAEHGIPLRHVASPTRYCGAFYGQSGDGTPLPHHLTADFLISVLQSCIGQPTELCCHPASAVDFPGMYAAERCRELEVLCDPRVVEQAAGFRLTHFGAFPG